jgi:tetratricopeptide (TPR) repeat protein
MANTDRTYAQRHYETSLDLFEQGQYDKALAQIEKAISKAPDNPDFYSTKGVFLHKMNDVIKAIGAYMTALEVAPDHVFSHYNLGLIYMKQNKTLQAIQEWEMVVKLKPEDEDAVFNIAVALSHLGRRQEAMPFYKRVLEINPEHIQAHQNLGVIFRDEGDFKKAKFHLNRLQELDSTYVEVVQAEILKCDEQEFLAQIEKDKNKFKGSYSNDSGDDQTEALMAIINEDFDQALEITERLIKNNPDNAQVKIIRGQALHGVARSSDAISLFMEVVAENPKSLDALFHLGNIFLGLGELEKALGYFERLKSFSNDFPLINENINSIRSKLKNQDSTNE